MVVGGGCVFLVFLCLFWCWPFLWFFCFVFFWAPQVSCFFCGVLGFVLLLFSSLFGMILTVPVTCRVHPEHEAVFAHDTGLCLDPVIGRFTFFVSTICCFV